MVKQEPKPSAAQAAPARGGVRRIPASRTPFLPGFATVLALAQPWPDSARAHEVTSPLFVNRYFTLIAQERTLDVVLSLFYGDHPGIEQRRNMDRNGDGEVDSNELAEERERWRKEAPSWFALAVDDHEARPEETLTNVDLGSTRAVARAPLTVEMSVSFPLSPGPHRLTLRALRKPPTLGETDMTIDLAQSWVLISTSRGGESPQRPPTSRLTWPVASEGTTAQPVALFTLAPSPTQSPSGTAITDRILRQRRGFSPALVAAACLVGLAGAAIGYRALRRRRA